MRFVLLALVILAGCAPAPEPDPSLAAIERHFGHLGDGVVEEAKAVAWCESKWDPNAVNGQYRGLFQLGRYYDSTIAFYGGDPYDPDTNAQAARDGYVSHDHTWAQWSCKP